MGAVILTNADNGGLMFRMSGIFNRRLVEVLFDGKPEAAEDLAKAADNYNATVAKFRHKLVIPANREAVGRLASRYRSDELGELQVRRQGASTMFDFGEWKSSVASRRNDDGTTSFVTIDPGFVADWAIDFVESTRNGRRALVVREAQHEYAFIEEL